MQPENHPRSYYAATAQILPEYPALQGTQQCDVCIVGGGFTGVSTSIFLQERGYSVVVLEANRIAWGASGRNGGQLIRGFGGEEKIARRFGPSAANLVWQLGVETLTLVEERIKRFNIDCDFKRGYLDVAMSQKDIDELKNTRETLEANGFPYTLRWIDRDDMSTVIGSERYIAGLLDMGSGHLHPLNLCIGEARAASGLGVRLFEQSAVVKIRQQQPVILETGQGRVEARHVVLAGNAYLQGVIPQIKGQVLPAGSYVIATEPLPDRLANRLLPLDTAVCDQRVALDYYRLSADRRLLFGGMCNYSQRQPASIEAVLRPKMTRVFPQLENVTVDYEWGGNIGISLNRIPQLGRVGGDIYYAQGYSGHGVGTTHVASRIIADAICGQVEVFDVFDQIRHWRLPGGRWFASPALALGMSWFRLKEILAGAG